MLVILEWETKLIFAFDSYIALYLVSFKWVLEKNSSFLGAKLKVVVFYWFLLMHKKLYFCICNIVFLEPKGVYSFPFHVYGNLGVFRNKKG